MEVYEALKTHVFWYLLLLQGKLVLTNSNPGESNCLKPVELDINSNKSTDQYICSSSGAVSDIVSYTAMAGYGFNKVKIKEGCCSTKDIWQTIDKTKYATYVCYVGPDSITLKLVDGNNKTFEQTSGCCGCSKTWAEVS